MEARPRIGCFARNESETFFKRPPIRSRPSASRNGLRERRELLEASGLFNCKMEILYENNFRWIRFSQNILARENSSAESAEDR